MHDTLINGQTGDRALVRRSGSDESRKPLDVRQPRTDSQQEQLEGVVAELVARQAEAIVETISARILQRISAEFRALERSAPPTMLSEADPIERIPIPTRVMKALRRLGVRTIGQLTEMREEDILGVPSLGEGSVRQLNRILALYGRKMNG